MLAAHPTYVRLKIAHLIHSDGPGGGPRTLINHVSYYCNFFDVTVLHGGSGYAVKMCRALGVRTIQVPLDRIYRCLWGSFILWRRLRELKPDVLFLHGQWAGPVGAIVGRLAGVPHLIYICHWPSFYTDWNLYRLVRNYLCECIPCRLADVTIAVSESNRYQYLLRRLAPEERILTIPNPIDLDSAPSRDQVREARSELGTSSEHCHVVSVGRLSDQKRVDWLLHAWVRVQAACPEARLSIIGDGPEGGNLRALARNLGIAGTCSFLGSRENAWNYLAAADLVVMTTVYEARGNVVLEAMASGKAVVANAVDGVVDSLENGVEGYLVPPFETNQLVERLIELIQYPARREAMGAEGKKSVLRFAKPKILEQYIQVIYRVLAGGFPPGYMSGLFNKSWLLQALGALSFKSAWLMVLGMAAMTGIIDYKTGDELSVGSLYLATIVVAGWQLDKPAALLVCLFCTLMRSEINVETGHIYSSPEIFYWNTGMRFCCWVIISWACASMRQVTERHRKTIADLQATLDRVQITAKIVPSCPSCQRVRTPDRGWQYMENVPHKKIDLTLLSSLCPECSRKQFDASAEANAS